MDGPRSHRDGADSTSFLVSLTAEAKHPDKSLFRGRGFILAHGLKMHPIMVAKTLQQEPEAADAIVSTPKWRAVRVCMLAPSSLAPVSSFCHLELPAYNQVTSFYINKIK